MVLLLMACSHDHHHDDHDEEDDEIHHSTPGVALSSHQIEEFGILIDTVIPSGFSYVIPTSGTIEASPADIYNISAKKSGIIVLSEGVSVGSEVKAGEKIGIISPEGVQGGDVSQAALANLNAAKAEYERLKPLHEEKLVTSSVYREAERAYREAEALAGKSHSGGATAVSSPVGGSIQNLYVKSGDFLEVGTTVATVAKSSRRILKADFPVREMALLPEIVSANFMAEGSERLIKLSDLEGSKISGNGTMASENGYIPVFFSFNGDSFISPGGFAQVYLIGRERPDVISVPRSALLEIQGNKYLYVALDDNSFEKRLVKTGATDGERVEILEGLKAGERIASKGASVIRMAEISAIAPPAHTHNH